MTPPRRDLYRGMDAATLDREYDARASVPSFEAEYARYLAASGGAPRPDATPVYDPSGQRLDLYRAAPGAPVEPKEDNAFAAPGLLAHGISVAVMDYALCPAVTLDEIVRQVRAAVAFLHHGRAALGLAPGPIGVGGSSAGGQLVGMLLLDGWQAGLGLPPGAIGTALALSGLFELEPLRHTHQNAWLRLDEAAARRNSPLLHLPRHATAHLIAAAGGRETAEFRRQTTDFTAAWTALGHRATAIPMPDHNHFDIALSLNEPDGTLTRAVAASMLSPPG